MASTGRFSPSPTRFGGGTSTIQTLLASLNAQRGTAYDTTEDSPVYAENEAFARMLAVAWEQNQRFANQCDPDRMTDFLPRWEKIFGITPRPEATLAARRAAVKERMQLVGVVPTSQELIDRIKAKIGESLYVGYSQTSLADAIVWWPGGATNPDVPWYSTAARILISVSKPASMTVGEFHDRIGAINEVLDPLMPAWATWNWYLQSPSGVGFFLDEDLNLDHQIFD